jgi:pimeloyl-ACP methyl ester carboxylesterase
MERVQEGGAVYGGLSVHTLTLAGDGPPFLFLPGFSDIADTWRPLMEELARRGRAAVAVDHPGSYRAGLIGTGRPLLPVLDGFTADLVRAHAGAGPVVLAGNSMGGVGALRAAQDPELPLAGVVPIAPAGCGHGFWPDVLEGSPLVRWLVRAPVPLSPAVIQRVMTLAAPRLMGHRRGTYENQWMRAYASQYTKTSDIRTFLRGGRELLAECRDCYELERIKVPVLAIWGDRDPFTPSAGSRRLMDEIPGTRVELMRGCGHMPQHHAPARVAELLIDFDRSCRQATSAAA